MTGTTTETGTFVPTAAERAALDRAIARAHEIARAVGDARNGIVAAILRGDQIVAMGENEVNLVNDPTRHAEIVAISRATHALNDPSLRGATLVSTLQPCEMCLAAMRFAGIARVVFAATQGRVASKYFVFGALDIAAFHAASPDGFDWAGGVAEDSVIDLYADGDE